MKSSVPPSLNIPLNGKCLINFCKHPDSAALPNQKLTSLEILVYQNDVPAFEKSTKFGVLFLFMSPSYLVVSKTISFSTLKSLYQSKVSVRTYCLKSSICSRAVTIFSV